MPTTYVAPSGSDRDIYSNVPSGVSIVNEAQKPREVTPVESKKTYEPTPEEQADYEALHKIVFGGGGGGGAPDTQIQKQTSASLGPVSAQQRLERSAARAAEPEPTWGETFEGAAKNFIPSAGRVIGETAKALTVNLPETGKAIGQIISGLSSKVGGAFGLEQTPEEKEKKEALVNALGRHYAETYGSVEGFKKALAKDPATILADLSLPFSGGAALGSKLARSGSLAQKALALTAKGSQYLDPVQAAVGVAGQVAKSPALALRGISAARSGVPFSTLTDIYNMAKQGNDVQREGFRLGREASEADIFDKVHNAFDKAAEEASNIYVSGMSGVDQTRPIDWTRVAEKIADEKQNLFPKGYKGPLIRENVPAGNTEAYDALTNAEKDLLKVYVGGNIAAADHFKRSLYNTIYEGVGPSSSSGKALNKIAGEIKDSISAIDSEYVKVMDQWQDWLNTSRTLKNAGATPGANVDVTRQIEKLLKSLKNPAKRQNTIDVLAEHDESIPYVLAGYVTKPAFRGAPNLMDLALSGLGAYALYHPVGAVGAAYAMSPRAGSITQTALGKAAKYGNIATSPAVTYPAEQLRPGSEGPQDKKQETTSGAATLPRAFENDLLSTPVIGATVPGAVGSPIGPNQFGIQPSIQKDLFESRIVPIESGGRQSAVSPKGAIGVSQIMPSTGPEAAKLAGEPWSLDRLKNDAEYNLKLGKAYFNDLVRIFNDPVIAAAAYNAGKGRVAKALETAKATGVDWVSLLPEETQNYVKKFTQGVATGGRIGRASGGRIMNHAAVADRLIAAADRAKKTQSKGTETLLNHSDDAIASALEIANSHI